MALAEVDIEEVTSPGGVEAWLVNEPSIPFVALEIRFKGGASLDAPGKRGSINLMTAILEEGAGDMDARAWAAARDSLAASFDFDVHNDALSISAKFLTENMDEAAELLRLAMEDPRFDQDALDRVRAQVQSIIRSNGNDPDKIAGDTFDRLAWGNHPYGTDLNGTAESVAALTREDMFDAKARVMARDRLYVGAVGDIDAERLAALLDKLFSGLPETGAEQAEHMDYTLQGGLTVVPFDTPQSVVSFGQRGIKRDDPDFFPAFVMMEILGGSGFNSRLMEEVREKRGLTYGIYAYLAPMDFGEIIGGGVASANGRVAQVIEVVRDEWAKLADEGVSAEELERAKKYLTGAYPLRFDGNGRIANILVGLQIEGLGQDYITNRNSFVEAVTVEDVKRVAKRLIDPDALHFVVVGAPEGLEETAGN
ncbi:M16 family metallopeptidase [Vannielia litorea]|uniref:M16 family metallopeptidase n=1 Tax=Vannielia litorea TaxID=1217970 RepID=UPI001C9418AB|nr:pitrilysin family protein [Vannielia litorea]MBY6049202.1 insulinase family protein [Vannielia litorea]MBY6076616.1 insulinase family protein [Vannielia litorea]